MHVDYHLQSNMQWTVKEEVSFQFAIIRSSKPPCWQAITIDTEQQTPRMMREKMWRLEVSEGRAKLHFFIYRVTHVNAQSNRNLSTDQILKNAEQGEKRAYNDRIIQMENRTFTPLIFGTNGAMGYECWKVS